MQVRTADVLYSTQYVTWLQRDTDHNSHPRIGPTLLHGFVHSFTVIRCDMKALRISRLLESRPYTSIRNLMNSVD